MPLPATLKKINMRRFLEEMRYRGPSTRADLTRAVGVTPPTSSSIIADLMESGFVEEIPPNNGPKGRPGKLYQLAANSAYVLGATIDFGDCRISSAGLDGNPREASISTWKSADNYEGLLDQLTNQISSQIAQTPGDCRGIGIAVPGLLDGSSGRVALSPNLHFLDGKSLADDLRARTDLPVICTQEEHALCLAEQRIGHAKGMSDFAVIDFSTGVGMGVVSGGHYVSGASGFAGEIGHMTIVPGGELCGCGNRGCLETVSSDLIVQAELSRLAGRKVTLSQIDGVAPELCEQAALRSLPHLAIGVATVVNLFNPQAVFVHGKQFDLIPDAMARLNRAVQTHALRPSLEGLVVERAVGNKMYGAVSGSLDRLFASVGPLLS